MLILTLRCVKSSFLDFVCQHAGFPLADLHPTRPITVATLPEDLQNQIEGDLLQRAKPTFPPPVCTALLTPFYANAAIGCDMRAR
jgi:hypothetical protein